MTRTLRRTAVVAAVVMLGALVAPVAASADTVGLAVAITSTSPVDAVVEPGATVSGSVTVEASASTSDSGTDTPETIVLLVDGAPTGDPVVCDGGNPFVCSATFIWDATGLTGAHALSARVTTLELQALDSADVSVTVSSPAPTATITAPAALDPVSGLVSVDVTATTAESQNDDPATIDLLVGATVVDTATCAGPGRSCSRTLQHDVTGLSGPLTLVARVTTTRGRTASDSVTVSVANPAPLVSFTAPAAGATVKGTVNVGVSASTAVGLSDFPASVLVVADLGTASQLTVGTVTCNGVGDRTCSGSVPWDTSAMTGSHTLNATVTTTGGVTASAAQRTVTVDSPVPSVSITSPGAGDTVSGTVFVDVSAATDVSQTEYPQTIELYADGVLVDSKACVAAVRDCTQSMSWDATGLLGAHDLAAKVITTKARTAESPAVSVTAVTPPFSVAITSPAPATVAVGAGATATSSGVVAVSVSASTDAGQNEFPAEVELLVDAIVVDVAACPGSPAHSCELTLHWNATTAASGHRIAARLTTSRAGQATSGSQYLFARSGSSLTLSSVPIAAWGGIDTVRGRVMSTTSGQPLVGVWVRLVLAPAVGKGRVVSVKTGVGGAFSYRTRVYSITRVTALVGNSWLRPDSAVVGLRVYAPLVCSTSASAYFSGSTGRGVCTVRYLPAGTTVRLRYYYKARWFTLASGRSTSTVIPFSFRFVARGTYYLQVVLGSSRVYTATAGRYLKVVIR